MRCLPGCAVLLLVAPILSAQQANARPDSAHLALWRRELSPPRTVMLRLTTNLTLSGAVVDRKADSLVLRQQRSPVAVDLHEVVAAWIRRDASKQRAILGGVLGAIGLGAIAAFVTSIEVAEGSSKDLYVTNALGGALLGGLVGGVAGGLVGATEVEWCPVEPGPDPRLARRARQGSGRRIPVFAHRALLAKGEEGCTG